MFLNEFLKYIQNEDLGLPFLKKRQIAPSKMKTFSTKIRIGYVHVEESFDAIFNMGYGSGKSPMGERVKILVLMQNKYTDCPF